MMVIGFLMGELYSFAELLEKESVKLIVAKR